MTVRSKSEITKSMKTALSDASPQIRVDVNKGPFFYLSIEALSGPLADASADVERVALLSTLQFPTIATDAETLAVARAFGQTLGTGGYAVGIAYVTTSRKPLGTDTYTVFEGDTFSTATNGGAVFEALESRSLTAANADAFYNSSTRRYELPVLVQAVSAGTGSNIAARTLTAINNGAPDFDGVINLTAFTGGSDAETRSNLYTRTKTRFQGLDNFSRGGLASRVQNLDTDRITAVALTYSTEYPELFYRLPDNQAIDVWVLNSAQSTLRTQSFSAAAGQDRFDLENGPVLGLTNVDVNGASVSATLVKDESLETGDSVREVSYVSLANPAAANDVVDITYTYDQVLNDIQDDLDGYYQADTGALFDADVLVRYAKTTNVVIQVKGTVLGTFSPTTVEGETETVIGDYLTNGLSDSPVLGGVRSPAELRDAILSQVPGIASLNIVVFARKSVSPLVETIDIPRHSILAFEVTEDLVVTFT
jgi:hypothetical protein